jgi:hypothetical protein
VYGGVVYCALCSLVCIMVDFLLCCVVRYYVIASCVFCRLVCYGIVSCVEYFDACCVVSYVFCICYLLCSLLTLSYSSILLCVV